jgi:uncharacterized C2H2 Zn-finger protein
MNFDKACSNGNAMIQGHEQKETQRCKRCGGSGLVEADRNEYNQYVLAHACELTADKKEHKKIKRQWVSDGVIPCPKE